MPTLPSLWMCRGHDADLAFAGRNDSRTVRANQARAAILQKLPGAHHVERRNAFGDADDQFDLRIGGFHDGVGGIGRRNENYCRVGAGLVDRFLHGVEDGPAFVSGAAFAGSDSADDLRAIGAQAFAWNVPSRPVKPCTTNRVLLSARIAIIALFQKSVVRRSLFGRSP